MSQSLFDKSLADGFHHDLQKLTGMWRGITRTWFEPDVLADESEMNGTIRSILGGRFVLHEYRGSLQGKPFDGIMILGYDFNTRKFQSAWMDSFHMSTGILFSDGEKSAKGFSVRASYKAGDEVWGWRTEIEIINDSNIIFTAYNITPAGKEAKGTETNYLRIDL